jgi:hypothetical protein
LSSTSMWRVPINHWNALITLIESMFVCSRLCTLTNNVSLRLNSRWK